MSQVHPVGAPATARAPDCAIQVLQKGTRPEHHAVVGNIETHVKQNGFFGGRADLDDALPELKRKACALGGDALVLDNVLTSGAAEDSHVHVWATVFRVEVTPPAP